MHIKIDTFNFKVVFIIIVLSISIANLNAKSYTFRNFSTADGLSHTMINCIIQDKLNFIWIGTSDGLNRFDGYSFKKYYSKKHDSLSLAINNVNAFAEDLNGKIWLATGSGFYYFCPVDESFRKVQFANKDFDKLTESICVDDSGVVWGVDNSNILFKINANTDQQGELLRLDSILDYKAPLYNKKLVYADGYLWIFSSAGVIRFDHKKMHAEIVPTQVEFKSPRIIRKGNPGELFVVDWNKGIYLLNTKDLSMKPYLQNQILAATKNNMGITDINYYDGTSWILSYPGLSKISESGEIEVFNTSSGYNRDYDKIIFFTSLQDKEGNLWLGTQDEGLIVINKTKELFNHYSVNIDGYKDLPASKFIINGDDILLCNSFGTFYGNKKNTSNKARFTTISNNVNVAISKYNKDEYLLFGKNKVAAFNKQNMQTRTLYGINNDIQNGIVDSRGILWLTHWEYGIEGYNPHTKEHYQIDVAKEDKSVNVVFCILEDRDSSLWLGTFGAGLQHVQNPASDNPVITRYVNNKNTNSINNNFITSLYDDERGTLWIGTNGGGLNRFNKADKTFESYTTEDGLRGNVIQSIVSDNEENIWFAANVITKFDVQTQTFTHLDNSDGFSSKYFTLNAQKTPDGIIYFGDDKGILYFNPKDISNKGIAPTPVFTNVRISGQPIETREVLNDFVPFPKSITYSDTIVLPYNLNSISLEFASIHFVNSENINYSYRLHGIDNQWIQASSFERMATYAGLPHGEYTLLVRASYDQNTWSEARSICIIITPPWWETIIFKIFITLLAVGLIFFYIQNLRRHNQRLERIVQKRTSELQQTNETLLDERLVIEMKNKHLNDVLESKEKLIHIVAHDFKNPLNGILGASQHLHNESQKLKLDKIVKYIAIITASANSLVNQMVSLLDWTQNEDENLQANPIEINAEVLVNDAINLVKTTADQKNISIESYNNSALNAVIDPRMGSMIFRNILSNAIKFTPKGGAISVIIKEMAQTIDISFIDNGIGIKQEVIEQFMTNNGTIESTLGTDNEIGTGIGLRMIKKFLDKNNGTLSITSAERQGSVFTVSIPKGHKEIVKMSSKKISDSTIVENEIYDNATKSTVLVVDDDEEILQTIRATLEPRYDIIQANNAQDGLNIALQIFPDIIISDINMVGMSGIELCDHIKKNKKTYHIPIILVSSYKKKEIKDEAFNAGANDYIEKPFNTFHLMKKVESLLVLKQKISEKAKNEIATEVFPEMSNNLENNILKKINQFVEENISTEKLNTNIVATELGISRAQLWRIYKKETGYSLGDYIKERKLQKASAMLLTGKYRISEIAYEIGYSDPRYFSRWFLKERGMTPTQFIEKMGNSL